ncbi:hypothetical protein D3C72_1969800 [compost metagenome]
MRLAMKASSAMSCSANGVRMRPGDTALTRTPAGPHSTARLRASWARAALVRPYRPIERLPRRPAMLEMSTALPPPRAAMPGSASAHSRAADRRLMSNT